MKYPCCLMQDLLPLYHDGVCSKESKNLIEAHLRECSSCMAFYTSLCEADECITTPQNTELEMKKASSLRAVKKSIRRKQILVVFLAFALFAVLLFSAIGFLKNDEQIISYKNNLSVSMVDGSLIGRLQGNQANHLKLKRVTIFQDEEIKTCLFFYLSGTKWDDIKTDNDVFSEYVLCAADKGAAQIDSVFYYTGDYTGIESMDSDDLQKIIDHSVLLWQK